MHAYVVFEQLLSGVIGSGNEERFEAIDEIAYERRDRLEQSIPRLRGRSEALLQTLVMEGSDAVPAQDRSDMVDVLLDALACLYELPAHAEGLAPGIGGPRLETSSPAAVDGGVLAALAAALEQHGVAATGNLNKVLRPLLNADGSAVLLPSPKRVGYIAHDDLQPAASAWRGVIDRLDAGHRAWLTDLLSWVDLTAHPERLLDPEERVLPRRGRRLRYAVVVMG